MTIPTRWFRRIWAALLVVVLMVEAAALLRRGDGDTLSEQVWAVQGRRAGRLAFAALWAWLTWHFLIEHFGFPTLHGGGWMRLDDIAIAAAGAGAAAWLSRRRA